MSLLTFIIAAILKITFGGFKLVGNIDTH